MVAPYYQPDYQDGIYVSIEPQAPVNGIALQAGWWNANTNTFWAGDGGPVAKVSISTITPMAR